MSKISVNKLSLLVGSMILFVAVQTSFGQKESACVRPDRLGNFCVLISERLRDEKPIGFNQYLYQRRFLEASCAAGDTDEEVQAKKIRLFWEESEDSLVCAGSPGFPTGGNIIKFAVSARNDDFIDDVIFWKVNLNKVDIEDDRTVLDYVSYHIDRNKGGPLEQKLQYYYRSLREAGALHLSELEAKGLVGSKSARLKKQFEKLQSKADSGDLNARWEVGWAYISGSYGLEKDIKKGLGIVESVAEKSTGKDRVSRSASLGSTYLSGDRVPKNVDRALFWFDKAWVIFDQYSSGMSFGEQANVGDGMHDLAKRYLEPTLATQDVPRAIALLKRGADTGSVSSRGLLGDLYNQGFGVPKNRKIAECLWYWQWGPTGVSYLEEKRGFTEEQIVRIDKDVCVNMRSK